ncbi:MAG: S1C family serine protease [Alphaproteobacteria bacterium]
MKSRVLVIAMVALLGACNSVGRLDIPTIAPTKLIEIKKPITSQASFALAKVIANIKRGTTVFHFPRGSFLGEAGTYCNLRYDYTDAYEDWASGMSRLGDWSTELGEIFYETLSARGLNVAGDPKDLFRRDKAATSAEYMVGARITEMRGNFCHLHHWWDGQPLPEFSGDMFLDVDWTIFSNVIKRKVLSVRTQGYYKLKKPRKGGLAIIFNQTFASATEKLLASQGFVDIALGKKREEATPNEGPVRVFLTRPLSKRKLARRIGTILPAVVTVRVGRGHGSGFVISEDGLVLTNYHVVGTAKRVAIVLENGVEVAAKVLARHEVRDVALIKMPLRVPSFLPLRTELPGLLEKVFVIGSPLSEGLKSTITQGVVSAVRQRARSGLVFIQSDVAISGGNSGGPMLDENGNVIGITVSGHTGDAQNLNYFIPIGEALKALNLKPEIAKD